VSLWDLVEAFGRMMEQVGIAQARHEVLVDDTPIELHAADLVDRLERDGAMTLQQTFEGRRRGEMVGLFLATLELVRQRKLRVRQDKQAGQIMLELRDPEEVRAEIESESNAPEREKPDVKDAEAFAWPDEQTKQRYVRRIERRAKGEFVEEDAELEPTSPSWKRTVRRRMNRIQNDTFGASLISSSSTSKKSRCWKLNMPAMMFAGNCWAAVL
jgi:segregation and condensation protein A